MRLSILSTLILSLALLVTGCGGGSADVTGKWTLDKDSFKEAMAPMLEAMPPEASAAFDSMHMTMEFKDDNTFHMSGSGGMGPDIDQSGTWSMEDGKIKIAVEGEKDAFGTVKGDVLTLDVPDDEKMPNGDPMPDMLFNRG